MTARVFCSVFPMLLLAFVLSPLEAQSAERHAMSQGNPALRNLRDGFIFETLVDDPNQYKSDWSSSFHPAEGKAPPTPDYEKYWDAFQLDDEPVWEKEQAKIDTYAEWESMYSSFRAQDGDPTTCWAASGAGIGEVLLVKVDAMVPVYISGGFQKSMDLFKKNSRPKKVIIYVLEPAFKVVGESTVSYQNVRVIASAEVELRDTFGPQPLPLPAFSPTTVKTDTNGSPLEDPIYLSFVAVKILSVYPGSKYDDTCISEISN